MIRRTRWQLTLIAAIAAVLTLPVSALAIPPDDPQNPGECASPTSLQLRVTLNLVGVAVAGSHVGIDATNARLTGSRPGCGIFVAPLPSFSWSLTARPSGSSTTLAHTDTLAPDLTLDGVGSYQIRFTACPSGCRVRDVAVSAQSASVTVAAASSATLPPDTEPVLPPLPATQATSFADSFRNRTCLGGGGVLDPQWVTVHPFGSAADYKLLEGSVSGSHSTTTDNPLNHYSYDQNSAITPDPPYRYLVSTRPEWNTGQIGMEWERQAFPEAYWPTPGDRVSVLGYWIFDCGHQPFYTEIHPPVAIAVQRSRPVRIPASFHPAGFPQGMGANVVVPGVATTVYINRASGKITNCPDTGLHQPSVTIPDPFHPPLQLQVPGACIRSPAALHSFDFHIYLPRDPRTAAEAAGISPPPVPLYTAVPGYAVSNGSGARAPVVTVHTSNGVTWLDVSIDFSSFTGRSYSTKILAAWAYPAADNWGIRAWRLALTSMDVTNDGDGFLKDGGDWRFWSNINNTEREWTNLIRCDDCVHEGTWRFGAATHTGAGGNLGSDLLLSPSQHIWVSTSGYDLDNFFNTNTGTVTDLLDQATATGPHTSWSQCSGDCASYKLHYVLTPLPVGQAVLSPAATALHDAYVIRSGSSKGCSAWKQTCVVSPVASAFLAWDPLWSPLSRSAGLRRVEDTALLENAPIEQYALTGISAKALKSLISSARTKQPMKLKRLMTQLRSFVHSLRYLRGEVRPVLTLLQAAVPGPLFKRDFPPSLYRVTKRR